MIRVVNPDPDFLPILDPGFQIQGSKRHRIPDPDPQHCSWYNVRLTVAAVLTVVGSWSSCWFSVSAIAAAPSAVTGSLFFYWCFKHSWRPYCCEKLCLGKKSAKVLQLL